MEEAAALGQVSAWAAAFQVAAVVALASVEARMDPEAPGVAEVPAVREAELAPRLTQETCGERQRSVAAAVAEDQG